MARPNAANWIAEATTTMGTEDVTLAGPLEGFAQFKVMPDGLIYYTIQDGVSKECGIGTLYDNGTKISRDTVLASFVGGVYAAPGQALDLSGFAECYCTVNADLFNEMNLALDKLDTIETGATADQNASQVPSLTNWLFKTSDVQSQLNEAADDIALYSAGATQNTSPNLFALIQTGNSFTNSIGFVNPDNMAVYRVGTPVSGTIVSVSYPDPDTASIVTSSPIATIIASRSVMATQDWVNGRESKVTTINAGSGATIDSSLGLTFDITLNQPLTALDIIISGESVNTQKEIIIILRQGSGNNEVTWPVNVNWECETEPLLALSQGQYDVFSLTKIQGIDVWTASIVGSAYGAGSCPMRPDMTLRVDLAKPDGFKLVGGTQISRMTLADAKAFSGFVSGQQVFITDVGYVFKFNPSRNVIPNQPVSEMTTDDEIHKLVSTGGMLEFDSYEKLRQVESTNYLKYLSRLRTNKSIGLVSYGDSITWGQRPDLGQYPLNYPVQIAQTMSTRTQCAWTSQNMASPGDRALTNYIRTINDGTSGHVSTIMLGINDIKAATNNGNNPADIEGDSLYGVDNYVIVMRKFIARELLRGRCVVVLGTTQWVGGANISPMGNLTECYLSDTYDSAARSVSSEFGCMFVDTMKDIIQQFGISESCHDGVHLREDFLEIIGKRFSCVFMHQDYKNARKISVGDVMIPAFFFHPVSSNRTIRRGEFMDGSSPPLGGGVNSPEAIAVLLPNDTAGGSVTLAFYLDTDSAVIYPSINSDGTDYTFDMFIDDGATQPDYPSDVEIFPVFRDRQYILSGRSIAGSSKRNRTTERYSQYTNAAYMHITTRGWHMITFRTGVNAGVASIEGLVCDSWSNVRNNDVFGGVSGTLYRNSAGVNEVSGFVTDCTTEVTGEFNVAINNLVIDRYRVEVEFTEDASLIFWRLIFKSNNSFRIQFYNSSSVLVNPTSFRVYVFGGR